MNDHQIDQLIDRVAARLVETGPDEGRVLRQAMAQLPERAPSPWFMAKPVQLAAAAALVVMAFVFARPDRQADLVESPAVAAATPEVPAETGSPIPSDSRSQSQLRPLAQGRPGPRSPIPDPRSPIPDPRSPIDRPDHEFSLPPVDAVAAIELRAITTPALAPVAMEALAPLVLTDLRLASDSSSPHDR